MGNGGFLHITLLQPLQCIVFTFGWNTANEQGFRREQARIYLLRLRRAA